MPMGSKVRKSKKSGTNGSKTPASPISPTSPRTTTAVKGPLVAVDPRRHPTSPMKGAAANLAAPVAARAPVPVESKPQETPVVSVQEAAKALDEKVLDEKLPDEKPLGQKPLGQKLPDEKPLGQKLPDEKPLGQKLPDQTPPANPEAPPVKPGAAPTKSEVEPEAEASAAPAEQAPAETSFVWTATPARAVYLAGDFNAWDCTATEMSCGDDGTFSAQVALEAGKYQYKFVVDGEWCYDITKACVTDECGNTNNVLTVE